MNQKADKRPPGRIKSSIVLRLNTRLFFRLLGIYLGMDLLLTLLFTGGMFIWSERRCAEVSGLVQERGVPTAEATRWMEAGDYIVNAGEGGHEGWRLPNWMPAPDETAEGARYFNPGDTSLFFGLVRFQHGGDVSYTVEMPNGGDPYAITLDLAAPVTFFVFVSRIRCV